MDRLSLTVLVAHNPRRALKWPSRLYKEADGWSISCTCAECATRMFSAKTVEKLVPSEGGFDRFACVYCGKKNSFSD